MKSLQDSKKILIVTVPGPNFDQYAALHALATSIKSFSQKVVHIGIGGKIADHLIAALPLRDMKVLLKLPPKKYIIEFKNQKNKVKNIQWNQEADALNFYISMEGGDFNSANPNLRVSGSDYDSIILVGVNSLSELGAMYKDSKDVFSTSNLISVGGKVQGEGLKITSEIDVKNTSVSEDMYYFMNKNGYKVDQVRANTLLAGVFKATNNFRKDVIDPRTYLTSAELIKCGAKNQAAQAILEKAKPSQKPQPSPQVGQREKDRPSTFKPFDETRINHGREDKPGKKEMTRSNITR